MGDLKVLALGIYVYPEPNLMSAGKLLKIGDTLVILNSCFAAHRESLSWRRFTVVEVLTCLGIGYIRSDVLERGTLL